MRKLEHRVYREDIESFVKDIELNVCIPKVVEALKSEINLILKAKNEQAYSNNSHLNHEQVETISATILQYLQQNSLVLADVKLEALVDYVLQASQNQPTKEEYSFLEFSEVKALENLLNNRASNPFPMLNQQQVELNLSLAQIPVFEAQVEQMKAQITGRDYAILKAYEDNEANIKKIEIQIADTQGDITKIDKRLHQYDIQMSQELDPRYETLGKLKGFFGEAANQLLKSKKQQIELKMKQDLNINLAAYRDVIAKVELSGNLANLTFKIFHQAGNEIYLNQLNTASKQVVSTGFVKSLTSLATTTHP